VERDLPQFGLCLPPATLRRFWSTLAHWQGNIWNGAEFARACGAVEHAVRRDLDALAGGLVVRLLQPWHENLAKRQVRSPKVYIASMSCTPGRTRMRWPTGCGRSRLGICLHP